MTIGIIVTLAGITVPLVLKFTGWGKTGAMVAEREAVQSAMNAMMADQGITAVTAVVDPATATNEWTGLPLGAGSAVLYGGLGNRYLKKSTTIYHYCWTSVGEVYARDAEPELSDDPGTCRVPP